MEDQTSRSSYGNVDNQTEPLMYECQPKWSNDETVITMTPTVPANQGIIEYDNCHLVWFIISVVCCGGFSVVAMVMSLLGYTDHRTGNYAGYKT